MDAGRIQQVGGPIDLYERPASLFVADFIGTNNFLAGTVADVSDGYVRVKTPAGEIRGVGRGDLGVGLSAAAAVRPENVMLVDGAGAIPAAAPGGENRLNGRIVLSQFMGSILRYEVETGGDIVLKIDIHDPKRHRPLQPGTEVAVGFDASAVAVYPSGGPARARGGDGGT